jgi:hypothetical protein
MSDILLVERGPYWARAEKHGFDVYKNGITHSVRVARIGFKGDEGLRRVNAEIDRRIAADEASIASHFGKPTVGPQFVGVATVNSVARETEAVSIVAKNKKDA